MVISVVCSALMKSSFCDNRYFRNTNVSYAYAKVVLNCFCFVKNQNNR